MKNITTIQNLIWAGFVLYYSVSKFLAGFQAYSHTYAIQVAIIIMATAIVPFYLTRFIASIAGSARLAVISLLPSLLAMAGYAGFFFTFIAPNVPDMAPGPVILRGLVPGIVISLILLLPTLLELVGAKPARQ